MNLDDHALFLAPCLKENEHQKNKAKGKNKKKGLAKTKNEYQNLKKYWSKSSYLKRKNYKDNSKKRFAVSRDQKEDRKDISRRTSNSKANKSRQRSVEESRLDNMEESKTYESETESQAEIESDPEYNSDSYSRSSEGDYDFDSGDESPEHIKQLLMDEEIEISSDFEKEIYLFILSRSLSLNPEDDLNEVTYFDPKLERMVDIYEMIILLCQGI